MSSGKTQKRKHSDDEDLANENELTYSDEEGGVRIDDIYIPPAPPAVCSLTSSGPRLIITAIVNEWFKSYSTEERVGPFHKCFNAIVGPNGSGKSNIIDSMLFVFGYRANKIRSKKLSTLLHNSEQHKHVQDCTVSVHFQCILDKGDNEYEVVPGSDFVVSRVAHKDNSSYYRLNGRKVQFKEVAVVLRKHGIDLDHNRFLILQGEVEQISMMKPKASTEHETGMLEYLEDIIGTSRYKEPLVKLNDRVEILTEQRTDKLNRLNLAQNELSELRAPMEEAVGFLSLENEIISHKSILYQNQIFLIEEQVKDKDVNREQVENNQKEIVMEIEKLTLKKVEKQNILKQQTKKYDSLTKKKDLLKEAFDKANLRDIQLQAEMQQQNTLRKKNKELLAEEIKKLPTYEKVPEEAAKSIEEYSVKEEDMSKKKEILEEDKVNALASIKNDTRELQEKRERIQTELIELNKIVNAAESAYTVSETELKIYVSSEESEQKKLENLMESYETTKKTIEDRKQQIVTLKKKIPLTQKSLKEARDEFNIAKLEEEKLVAEIRKKRAIVEESKASMQASRSRGRVLDSLMQQKQEGKCPGLFGRLGDLGAINEKYDVAISTACGSLDNIVVDTVNTAQWCIEFLKRYDIGRATFIALEKQEHLARYANSTIQTPENVPRLFDLVRIEDDRLRTAFYFALRDTLVSDNLDQASRIAYGAKRYRVVTLRGELIETTGTMSGGGKSVSRGRMGQSLTVTNTSPLDVQNMEEELGSMMEKVLEFRRKQEKVEAQINALLPELRNMEINLEKFVIELRSLSEQEPALSKQLQLQANNAKATKADPAQVRKLTAIVNKEKKIYEEAAANAAVLQVQVDAIAKEIKDMVTSRTKAINKNLNDVNKTIDKCRAEISRLKVSITTAQRNFKKSSERIVTMEKDITQLENNLRAMKADREEIENDAQELLTCIEEITVQLNEGDNEYSEIKMEVSNLTKKENKLQSDKIEIDQKLKTIKKVISDLQGNIHNWKSKIKKLKLQQIPDMPQEELKVYTAQELQEMNIQAVERKLQANEEILKASTPNLNAIEEYLHKQTIYVQRAKELEQVSENRNKMREMFDSLRNRRKQEFLVGYNTIKIKLKEMYQMITLGGDADFEMVDSYDPFTEGIQFNVRPPKKSWKHICNLSGGEKTLSSLALVFALHYYKPSPLYVMDEIDAALDFKNVSIVGHYIKERTKNAQFIIISLRSNMFELCDHLVGIYKTLNCTHSVTIDPRFYGSADINFNEDNEMENEDEEDVHANICNGNSLPAQGNMNMNNEEDDLSIALRPVTSSDDLVIADSFTENSPSMDVD